MGIFRGQFGIHNHFRFLIAIHSDYLITNTSPAYLMATVLHYNDNLTLPLKEFQFEYTPSSQSLLHVGHLESPPVYHEPLHAFHLYQSSWRGVVVEAAECSRIMITNSTYG